MAPTVAGTNVITQAEDSIVYTLANLAAFQTWTGTGDATAAAARCHVGVWDDFAGNTELLAKMPYALILEGEDAPQIEIEVIASPWEYQPHWAMAVMFCAERPTDFLGNKEDRLRQFKNAVGDIVIAWRDVVNTTGNFAWTTAMPAAIQWSQEANSQTDYLVWEWTFIRRAEVQG